MINFFKKPVWSPYITGSLIGFISVVSLLFFYAVVGASTVYIRLTAFFLGIFSEDHVLFNDYMSKYVGHKPVFEFQFMLLIGIFIGAFLMARTSGVTLSKIPYLWGQNIGFSIKHRRIGAMLGGFLIIVGSRMAGGCTVSHVFSGAIQFATASWMFIASVFAAGIVTAHMLYRKK